MCQALAFDSAENLADEVPLDAVGLDQNQGPLSHGAHEPYRRQWLRPLLPGQQAALLAALDLGAQIDDQRPHRRRRRTPMNPIAAWMNAAGDRRPAAWPRFAQIAHGRPCSPASTINTTATPIRYAAADRGQPAARRRRPPAARAARRWPPGSACPPSRRGSSSTGPVARRRLSSAARSFRVPSEQRPGRAGGDHRPGDHDRRCRRYPSSVVPASSTSAVAVSMASGSVCGGDHPLRPEPLLGAHRRAPRRPCARGDPLCGDDDLVERRLQRGEDAVDVLVRHHRHDADQEAEVELARQAPSASAAAPAGLCAASMNTVGALRIRSSRPGLCTAAKPARTASTSS